MEITNNLEVFEKLYEPELDEDGDLKRYETYGEEWEEAKRKAGDQCQYLWTIVDGDDDSSMYILPGFHLVNRQWYIITRKPWDSNNPPEQFLYD